MTAHLVEFTDSASLGREFESLRSARAFGEEKYRYETIAWW